MKITATLLFLFFSQILFAQNDFVVLQKRGRTIERYFTGNNITVYTKDNFLISGNIKKCVLDTIFLEIPITRDIPTMFGVVQDTTGYTSYKLPISQVKLIPARRWNTAKVGNMLVQGGILVGGILLLNKVHFSNNPNANYIFQFFSAGAINVAMAFIRPFGKGKPAGYHIGKKYQLVMLKVSNP